jgi:hypothetical protein
MRNLAPSVMSALPHIRPITDCERDFNARRLALAIRSDAELLAARQLFSRVEAELCADRPAPRDGRGRYLSKAWLRDAETFSAADFAWFRHPVSEEF